MSIAKGIVEDLALGFGGGGSPIVAVTSSVDFLLAGKELLCVFLLAIDGETARQARQYQKNTFWN